MSVYTVKLIFDTFRFSANLADAAASISYVNDERDEETGEWTYQSTPYQTADARHRVMDAALLVLGWLGSEYWLDPSDYDEETDTYAGKTLERYMRDLIISVTEDQAP